MNTLVIYFSLEGNTKQLAEAIKQEINSDIIELHPKKDLKGKGFSKFFWGGKQVMFKEKPELLPYNKDFSKYDLIIMGSPVWAGTYAPAFETFLSENSISNKKIALFATFGGSEGKIFTVFRKKLNGNEIVGEIGFKDLPENEKNKNFQEVKKWAKGIITNK